jgi:PhnB protein
VTVATSIQPQLWVGDGPAAVAFYEQAFGAVVLHRVDGPEATSVVAQLSVGGACFWVSDTSQELGRFDPVAVGGGTGRMLLVVENPAALLGRAVEHGATELSPVGEEHGWLLGRLCDPFGHEWEVGHPLVAWPPGSGAQAREM